MPFEEKVLETLEFHRVRVMLADCALTEGARRMAMTLTPAEHPEAILRRQRYTTDARRLLDAKGVPGFGAAADVSDAAERAEKGATLSTRELLDVADLLRTCRTLQDYSQGNHLFNTSLDELFDRLIPDRVLEERIFRSILSEEQIADEASRELADIRRKIRQENNRIREILQKYASGANQSKYLQESLVTIRNGRYVIPVKTEYKNEVDGLIHDTSASGATVFIEPVQVVEANNGLRLLEAKEAREIERILAELSAMVADLGTALRLDYRNVTELSFYFACALLSEQMRAVEPQLSGGQTVCLKQARHPLIDPQKVVPIDLTIGGEYDTLVITGPNTGGKTASLKTLGLLALMAQSGLHIPAEEPSSLCVFDRVLVDLGDEQSLEQSLSTFSSHMSTIVKILDEVTDRSLVLFDELGVGTDPVEGAALAEAIIEQVRLTGTLCLVTTHYTELKTYALDTEGVMNASCEFDVETLRPTYKLILGAPGRSNAFAISRRLGLSEEVLARAQGHIGTDFRRLEDVIEQLDRERLIMEHRRAEAEQLRVDYERFKAEAEKKLQRQVTESEKTLETARQKAIAMVESARASSNYVMEQMEKLRREKESARMGEVLEETRRNVREYLRKADDAVNPVEDRTDKEYVLPRPLKKGDNVYLMNIGKEGILTEDPDKNGNVTVKAGILTTRTKIANLKLLEDDTSKTAKKIAKKSSEIKSAVNRDFKPEVDLRGMMGDEAWFVVDKYLDDAQLVGIHSVRLVHGKGTGALRKALWNYLKTDRRVAAYRIGQYGEGDGGVTVVEVK